MSDWDSKANEIFLNALEIDCETDRAEYVGASCGEDGALRQEVEELLRANEKAGGFLDGPIGDPDQTTPHTPVPVELELEEAQVGPYLLRSVIAEGGMGVVYEADQEAPVRRTVALKIIKPGTDSKDVIARFESERQTLALMDHRNIARVVDAGSTDSGQPYFVMELVRGRPITDHCDEQRLSVIERLELFMQVCQAVQHAHQKGIIHRDIKPSNVLVTIKDGEAVPKVIDFGVAKALDQPLVDKAHRTRFTQMVGTPLYMSPEQASLNSIDVDTRSDIYSLGVLLYELLTGSTPDDLATLEGANYAEFRRIKCEEEPLRPSVKVRTEQRSITTVAEQRATGPAKLTQGLRGELDWIVMRALEKDRQRRYQTARGFAADIRRCLHNEPVEAGPPSTTYRIRKFIGRHRGLIAAATLFVLILIAGAGVSTWQAIRATNAEQLAKQRLLIANSALRELDTADRQSRRNRAQALTSNGAFLAAIKRYSQALRQYRAAVYVDPESPQANNNFAWFLATCPDTFYRDPVEALPLAKKATELVPDEGTFWNTLGVCYYRAGQWQNAIKTLEKSNVLFGDTGVGFNATFIAMAHWQMGNHEEAQRQYDIAVNWMRENQLEDEELVRFCREAAELLGRGDDEKDVHTLPDSQ